MVLFNSPRKISSYLVRAELYPLDRVVGSTKCDKKLCEVCVNVSETNTCTSNVTGDLTALGIAIDQLTALGIDGITIRIMIESILIRRAVCKNICLNILTAWDTMVSLTMFQ